MVTAADIETDAQRFDGTETINLTISDATVLSDIENCLREALSRDERSYAGVDLIGNEVVWHIPAKDLTDAQAGAEPEQGNIITDSVPKKFAVLAVEHDTLGTRWRCLTRRVD